MSKISEEILTAVKNAALLGRLSCKEASRLAVELGVSTKVIGAAADQLNIKIKDCQLGCF